LGREVAIKEYFSGQLAIKCGDGNTTFKDDRVGAELYGQFYKLSRSGSSSRKKCTRALKL